MGFSRPRKQDEHIIKSKVNILKKVISIVLTSLMWVYSLLTFAIFISAIVDYNNYFLSIIKTSLNINNNDLIYFLSECLLIFIIGYLALTLWKVYNKRRFGKLNRRKYPPLTTDDDMLNLNLIDPEDYYKLQNNKVTIFLSNPIIDMDKEMSKVEETV